MRSSLLITGLIEYISRRLVHRDGQRKLTEQYDSNSDQDHEHMMVSEEWYQP